MTYDKNAGLDICDVCGEYVIDGYCDCELVPDWEGMLEIARKDYASGVYEFNRLFIEFLRWKNFPQEIIEKESNEHTQVDRE